MTTTQHTTASGAADWSNQQYLQQLAKHYADSPVPEIREHHRRLTEIARALAACAPVAPAPITEAEQAAWHAGLDEGRSQARGAAQAAPAEPDMRSVALAAGAYTTAYSMLTHAKVHNADVDGSTKRLVAAINGLRSALGPSAPVAEDAEIRKALHDAATSLETISRIAGRDQCMLGMMDVRLYAAARSKVAREALAAQPEGGA